VRHLKAHPEQRTRQQNNVARLKAMLQKADLPLADTPSHILPLIIGDAHLCRRISELLLSEHSIYVQPINYPTVRAGRNGCGSRPPRTIPNSTWRRWSAALVDVGAGQRRTSTDLAA
jgi:5-aminolevulinate synthase